MIPLPPDFKDFLLLLNANGIRYLVIGGYAVAFHGYVRHTGDLDVFVELSVENAEKLTRALRQFGFDLPRVKPALFLQKGKIIRMGYEPTRLEILNEIDGVSFQECYRRRRVADLDGLKINFIALPQLLKNKRASRRLKDLADVEALDPGKRSHKQ
jgi:hypothetical protein